MRSVINWKLFALLLGLSILSVICVFPYVLTLQGELLKTIGQPIWFIFAVQIIQSLILFAIAIFVGLYLVPKTYFQLPLFGSILQKGDYKKVLRSIFAMSILSGIIVAVIIYGLDTLFTAFGAGITTHQVQAPVWQTLLASFYGGITEEILMRLFLMTLMVWIGMKLFRRSKPTTLGIVIPILIAAIIFGLGHLPITASLTTITPLVIARAVVLNGVGGVVFGWLYWKRGLESAMIAHFTADVFLLSLLPML